MEHLGEIMVTFRHHNLGWKLNFYPLKFSWIPLLGAKIDIFMFFLNLGLGCELNPNSWDTLLSGIIPWLSAKAKQTLGTLIKACGQKSKSDFRRRLSPIALVHTLNHQLEQACLYCRKKSLVKKALFGSIHK